MLKRVTLVIVSLLLLNGCTELIGVIGGDVNDNTTFSPNNNYIQLNNVHSTGFDLSWDQTYYNNGSTGSFYYELYVVAGNHNNVYSFNYYDVVAEGWNLFSYNVTGLESGTTYSYVVGVSDDEFGSQVYYNIGSATTEYISLDFVGDWYSENEGMYDVFTFDANNITIGYYDIYGNIFGEMYGSLTTLSSDTFKIVFEYESDEYPYDTVTEEYVITWSVYGNMLNLTFEDGSTDVLYAFDESIFSEYVEPSITYMYPSYSWVEGYLEVGGVTQFTVYVTPGSRYEISWNDYDGNGTYSTDIKVSAYDEFGYSLFTDSDSGYYSGQYVDIPYNVYSIDIMVEGLSYGENGFFGLKVEEIY